MEGLYFPRELSLKISTRFTSFNALFFFSLNKLFCFMLSFWCYFILISSSGNVFFFGDFKGYLTYSGGTDRPGEFCYKSFQTNFLKLMKMTFLTVILTLVYVLQWLSLLLEMLFSQFPLTFLQTKRGMLLFIAQLISCGDSLIHN